jgi:hypothetical protein
LEHLLQSQRSVTAPMIDESRLREIEHHLVDRLEDDPRLLKFAQWEGITVESFRYPSIVRRYRRVVEGGPRPNERRDLLGSTTVRKWARQLVDAAPGRPAYVEQPPPPQEERPFEPPAATAMRRQRPSPAPKRTQPDQHAAKGSAATTTVDGAEKRRIKQAWEQWARERNKVTGKLAKLDRSRRKSQLKGLRWHLAKQFRHVDAWIADLKTKCGHDPLDRDSVNDYELGRAIGLSLDGIFDLEEQVTDFGRAKGWGEAYRFRIDVIAPYDATPAEREAARLKRRRERGSANRKAARAATAANKRKETTTMQTQQQPATFYATYAEAVAAQKKNTRAQCMAILKVLDRERGIDELVELLADHPAWRALASDARRFRRTILHRLDMLRDRGRIVDRHGQGPRGSRPRFVSKTPAASETDDCAAQESIDEIPF